LAALFQTLEATALDDAVEVFDALATDIFAQAEEAHSKSRLCSLSDLDAAAIMLRDVGQHVVADDSGEATPHPYPTQPPGAQATPRPACLPRRAQ